MQDIIKTLIICMLSSFALISCYGDIGSIDNNAKKSNPYIKEIKYSDKKKIFNHYMAVWKDSSIWAVEGIFHFELNGNYDVARDTIFTISGYEVNGVNTYIEANEKGTKLLLGVTSSDFNDDMPKRYLFEYDVLSNRIQLVHDKNKNVASARYYPNDDSKIVYYSFGDSLSHGAGYYLLDRITQQDTLLFPYLSSAGIWETLHGFDIHPNGTSLLVPISQCAGKFVRNKPPRLGIASLKEQKLDTLNIEFDLSFVRTGLWVRYNHNGSRILYSCFPDNAYGYVTNDNSEVGIIDVATFTKRILDVNTNRESNHGSVQLAPNWSPDETAIVYGSGDVNVEGMAGTRRLYILTKIE